MSAGELMGRNEYARHRGCSPNAVLKAVADGRIADAAVVVGGKIKAIRWRLADELWAANTDPGQVRHLPRPVHASGLDEDVRFAIQAIVGHMVSLVAAATPARRPEILRSLKTFAASLAAQGAGPSTTHDPEGESDGHG